MEEIAAGSRSRSKGLSSRSLVFLLPQHINIPTQSIVKSKGHRFVILRLFTF